MHSLLASHRNSAIIRNHHLTKIAGTIHRYRNRFSKLSLQPQLLR
jgi:hypothetical protein